MMRTCFSCSSVWSPGLNIAAARVALVNWIYAKQRQGSMVIRMDDVGSYTGHVMSEIRDHLLWLGILYNEGPYYVQHSFTKYRSIADALIAEGCAYKDYATRDELTKERNTSKDFRYTRKWAAFTHAKAKEFEKQGRKYVIRLKMPRKPTTVDLVDMIHGKITLELHKEHDHVIIREDGTPTYYLSTPVDYHQYNIDTVFSDYRHAKTLPTQYFIFDSLGWKMPKYGHIPMLTEPTSNRRFSKRYDSRPDQDSKVVALYEQGKSIASEIGYNAGDKSFYPSYVSFYRQIGFLPNALVGYLISSLCDPTLANWYNSRTPQRDMQDAIKYFDIATLRKTSTHFDCRELAEIQLACMKKLTSPEITHLVKYYLSRANLIYSKWYDKESNQAIIDTAWKLRNKMLAVGDILFMFEQYTDNLRRIINEQYAQNLVGTS